LAIHSPICYVKHPRRGIAHRTANVKVDLFGPLTHIQCIRNAAQLRTR
jgi:hypothetical protein